VGERLHQLLVQVLKLGIPGRVSRFKFKEGSTRLPFPYHHGASLQLSAVITSNHGTCSGSAVVARGGTLATTSLRGTQLHRHAALGALTSSVSTVQFHTTYAPRPGAVPLTTT
jgi:hypothetical protein